MTKKLLVLLFVSFSLAFFAQAPQGINYQGVARDNTGAAMSSTNIAIEFKLWLGNPSGGSIVYSEFYTSVPTDTFGLYSRVIGAASGTANATGVFSSVPWSGGNIWVEVYIDPTNAGSFTSPIAAQQLMSVPYALYAQTSGGGSGSVGGQPNNIPRINNAGNGLGKSLIFQSTDSLSIGINNPSPLPDAVLDIINTGTVGGAGKGLLIPRMTYNERSLIPVSNLHNGLLVYQTNSQNAVTPEGFWYYDAVVSSWLLLSPAQAVWTLNGNFISPGNFMGSLNAADVVFKTGSGTLLTTERMRMLNGTGGIQFGDPGTGKHYIFPALKGNPGDVLQMDPSNTNNLIWTPLGSSTGFWTKTGTALYPTILSDSVGIGTSTPQAKLDIFTNTGIGLQVVSNDQLNPGVQIITTNPAQGFAALDIDASATIGNGISSTAGNAIALSGASQDANALWVRNNSNSNATIDAQNSGTHSVAYLVSTASGGTPAAVLYSTASDPTQYTAEFVGGAGIKTDNITISGGGPQNNYFLMANSTNGDAKWSPLPPGLPPAGNGHILYDSLGAWKPSLPGNLFFDGKKMGIGNPAPNTILDIISNTITGGVNILHNGITGHALAVIIPSGSASGNSIHASNASTSTTSNGIFATNTGAGGAGFFSINSGSNTSSAVYATTNGSGSAIQAFIGAGGNAVGISSFANGGGHAILANSSGGGDAVNATSSGTTGIAGNFQVNNNTSAAPAVMAITNGSGPAIKAVGGTGPAALFLGGAVGVATPAPTSGLDVKTSMAVSVKKYISAATFTIPLNDQNVVHIATVSGNTTFIVPDATMCPGRILIFTFDPAVTGGNFIISACCAQTINGGASATFSYVGGVGKPSIGIVSDGTNWQIIFKN